MFDDDSNQSADICRVCRSEGLPDRPLFHPCICTGSIKFIHQECLLQWMRYSRKEYCELCGHRFSFTPIYSPDMPRRLPLKDVAAGLLSSIATAVKHWCHYTLVAGAWLGVVPLTACRIYRCLFTGSVHSVLTLPLDLLSMENLAADVLQGCLVVTCTLFAFLGLVWLREQILHGGGPDWLEQDVPEAPVPPAPVPEPEPPEEEQPAQQEEEQPLVGNAEAEGEEGEEGGANWNPIEWNGAAEELTWERLLGLDGSLVFLEHVFWVVSLNTLFVLVFAFCPYHIGHFVVMGLRLGRFTSHFEGLVTTLTGYCVIGLALVILHALASLLRLTRSCRVLGLCYVVVKVSLLCVVEVGVLPLVCGWWLDVCSLAMFDATLKDRELSFSLAPGTSLFIHWLVGMVYVYYFASFVLLLREVVRPGVLWFLRNLNDPDFSPIQEMIHMSVTQHVRRLLLSAIIFGTAVLLMLWLPVHLLRALCPGFLPYVVALTSSPLPPATTTPPPMSSSARSILTGETAVTASPIPQPEPTHGSELSLELLLLQVVLPALLEQSHTRAWLKATVRGWCVAVAWLLGLRSYLLGDSVSQNQEADQEEEQEQEDEQPLNLGEAHQQVLASPPVGAGLEPYWRPRWFAARVTGLLFCLGCSLVIASLCALTVPVWLGRRVLALAWAGRPEQPTLVHELYTAAAGTYLCWAAARATALVAAWAPRGRAAVGRSLRRKIGATCRALVAAVLLLGVVPLLFGTLLECVVVVPLRVPLHQTPVLCAWHDWALGVLYTKIACAVTLMGPNWWLKTALERAYRDGLRELNLGRVLTELTIPVIIGFGLALAVPYILSQSVAPLLVSNPNTQILIERRIYPFLLLAALTLAAGIFQIRQFRRLYEHIKNDKYLVGRRLVNYDHQARARRAQ